MTTKPYKRSVYFVGAMVPEGPRYYSALMKKGIRQYNKLYDTKATLKKVGEWQGNTEFEFCNETEDGTAVKTEFRFLAWNDIVKERMKASFFIGMTHGFILFFRLLLSGDLFKIYRYYFGFGNGIMLLSVMPLLTQLLIMLSTYHLLNTDFISQYFVVSSLLQLIICYLIGLSILVLIKNLGDPMGFERAYHLVKMRFDYVKENVPDLSLRMEEFKLSLKQALKEDDCDEFLLVAHSYGTVIAVDLMADILTEIPATEQKPGRIGFVTLGAIHHLIATHSKAIRYIKSIKTVGGSDRLHWFEPFIPQDGMNFPKRNPVHDFTDIKSVSGPVQKSVKYKEIVSPETYKRDYRNFWKMHFQYFLEGEYKGDYSFYRMMLNNKPLSENYGLKDQDKQ